MRYLLLAMFAFGSATGLTDRPTAVVARLDVAGPVIARIVGRGDVIVVRAGDGGPTYSLETKKGEVIVPAMTAGELAMKKPRLSRTVKTMQADTAVAGLE